MKALQKPLAKIRGGAHVPHYKETAEGESLRMPTPQTVLLPMRQHIGAYCKPTVKVGEEVLMGQVIGDADAHVIAPIHAPVSGKVKQIMPYLLTRGVTVDAVLIENDGQDTLHPDVKPPVIHNKADFIKAVRASGLVGIGGAGFPTHVKLNVRDDVKIDTLVINGAECEPYITSDYREIMENHMHVITGIQKVMEYINIPHCLIGIEDNKPKAIELLAKEIEALGLADSIKVVPLPSFYPHGAEKQLIYAMSGRKVPVGKLPSDVGMVVLNISSVSVLNYYLDTGMPLIRKRVTVAGKAIKSPCNVFVPVGTMIEEVAQFCGGYLEEPTKILMGGPMMGVAQYDANTPVYKQNNALLFLTPGETYAPREEACIRCGRCVSACPMNLMPTEIERAAKLGDETLLKKFSVQACMECGSCAFACPSKRPLGQYLRYGKLVEREGK